MWCVFFFKVPEMLPREASRGKMARRPLPHLLGLAQLAPGASRGLVRKRPCVMSSFVAVPAQGGNGGGKGKAKGGKGQTKRKTC